MTGPRAGLGSAWLPSDDQVATGAGTVSIVNTATAVANICFDGQISRLKSEARNWNIHTIYLCIYIYIRHNSDLSGFGAWWGGGGNATCVLRAYQMPCVC